MLLLNFSDLCIAALSLLCSLSICSLYGLQYNLKCFSLAEFLSMRMSIGNFIFGVCFLCLWHALCDYYQLYRSKRFENFVKEIQDIVKVTSAGTVLLFFATSIYHAFSSNYKLIHTINIVVVFWLSSTILTILFRFLLRFLLRKVRIAGRNLRYVVVIGTNPKAYEWARKAEARKELGVRVIGHIDNIIHMHREEANYLGTLSDFPTILQSNIIDEVVIALPLKSHYDLIQETVIIAEEQGVPLRFTYPLFNTRIARSMVDFFADSSDIMMSSTPYRFWQFVVKRTLDIIIALSLAVLLSPLIIMTAIAIKLTSKGPALFVQDRVGLNKRIFQCYKFRSMVVDAENMQSSIETNNEMDGAAFKIKNDPRVTPLGKFLRKTSIDELPQLFNVIKGDISLVGPRPLPIRDYKRFDKNWQRRRLSVLPGITCTWQISGRNNISFEEWMKLDMNYIDNWSLRQDFIILLKTIPAVLRREGAC